MPTVCGRSAGYSGQKTITNRDLHQKINQCCIGTNIKRRRWRWIGHVFRKGNKDQKISPRLLCDGHLMMDEKEGGNK